MGPYCKFCGHRCFVPLPMETPEEALNAYGTATIVATCKAGQEYEKRLTGWCLDDIQAAINAKDPAWQRRVLVDNTRLGITSIVAYRPS